MAAVSDTLETVLEVDGLQAWSNAFQQAENILGVFGSKVDRTTARMASFAAAAGFASLAGLHFFGRAAMSAGEDAAAFQRAAGNFKGAFPEDELADFSAELQGITGVADDAIANFLGLLGTFQVTGQAAKQLARPILNAAEALKAQGVTTEQIAVQVGKALQTGEPTALKRSGIILDEVAFKAASAEERVRLVADALQAQGGNAADIDTLPESMRALSNALGDVQEELGKPLIPIITGMANAAKGAAQWFTQLPGPVKTLASVIGVTLTVALGAASLATTAAIFLQTKYLKTLAEVAAKQKEVGDGALDMGGKQAAGGGLANAGGATGGLKGWFGKLRGFGGKALGFAGKLGGPLALLSAGMAVGGTIADGMKTGDWMGAPNRALGINPLLEAIGLRKPAGGGGQAKDPLLVQAEKQTEIQQKQLDAMQGGKADKPLGAPSDFMPIGQQIVHARRFSRAVS